MFGVSGMILRGAQRYMAMPLRGIRTTGVQFKKGDKIDFDDIVLETMDENVGKPMMQSNQQFFEKKVIDEGDVEMPRSKVERSVNQVTLIGRVGTEPAFRGSEKHPVVTFSLATNEFWKNNDGDLDSRTLWHNIAVFKPELRTNAYNYIDKGKRVYIQGRISYGEITDKDGNVRKTTNIIADDIMFFNT
eukprot:TRINITY_DN6953_c0_g1_i2.p1 TRINITY_DN6953_c0_g1~~TRINITY_DN6953_c0_g1_i2.p1  ORF type:complete len:203 (-),score=33.60 TRINITY_DN6953_c0_g1_i2:453-1019(-)